MPLINNILQNYAAQGRQAIANGYQGDGSISILDPKWWFGENSLWSSMTGQTAAKQSASEQMAFQERMSNSAYQRQMADMRASGINPIMAAGAGGASSPQGAGYEGKSAEGLMSTALESIRLRKDIEEAQSRIDVNKGTSRKLQIDNTKKGSTSPLWSWLGDTIKKLKESVITTSKDKKFQDFWKGNWGKNQWWQKKSGGKK